MRFHRAIFDAAIAWATMFAGACAAEMRTLLVPIQTIDRGAIVGDVALREKSFILGDSQLPNWVSARTEIVGREARRTLAAGKPIPVAALKIPDAVKRGRPARAIYRSEGLEITTVLTPLQDAPAGAVITARNPETGVVVEALVAANGELSMEAH
jgi:flagella basal body P-ring formation protein FlgA